MGSIENLKTLKNHSFLKKYSIIICIICRKYKNEDEKKFKEEASR